MTPFVENATTVLALGTVLLELGVILLLILSLFEKRKRVQTSTGNIINRYALAIVFLLSLGASALTLLYSEVFGFIPCSLCWLQRVFLYPIVILSGIALVRRHHYIISPYIIGLALPGALIALYQHYLQMGGPGVLPCPASGAGDCAQRIIFEFGHITFPYMAFVVFACIIAVMLFVRFRERMV